MKVVKELFKKCKYKITRDNENIIEFTGPSYSIIFFKKAKLMKIRYNKDMSITCMLDAYELKAIHKQLEELGWVAEEPYIYGDGYSDGELVLDTWDCPNCGKTYEVEYERYDYCPNCGQQIKW